PGADRQALLQQRSGAEVRADSSMRRRAAIAAALLIAAVAGGTIAQTQPGKSASAAKPASTATAIFAGGCFWCTEADFDKVEGVLSTTSGYIGGRTPNPTYESVSANTTGHAEAVQVVYDPSKVSYAKLVEYFWRTIDPTVRDQQFCDIGSSYRSAIFVSGPEQRTIAEASKKALTNNKPFSAPIVTEIVDAKTFYPAESYHQDYYNKNAVRYKFYRFNCGRDARLKQLWGDQAMALPSS
ncbi:MAG: peptide-methionine (S)-S-oxide reductase MsrA, partial [Burkholderiaceae bacterium]